ncbi:hypothetical protein MP638_002466 [Amoeboaphelidium occidentale]|nr:hypothetical protein MP638_002466 [Amoeboaphelidium occidentale]
MRFITGFIIGGICGVYAAQNYTVPDVKKLADDLFAKLKDYEKSDKDKNKKN